MTIQSETNKILYTGNGSTTVFAYNFRVDNAGDMSVYIDGVILATGWSIDGIGVPTGGNVTFDTAPADQATIALLREIAIYQLVDYVPYDPFPAETHEAALDKLTMICQQLAEEIGRALVASPDTPASVDNSLPPYSAGKGIMWHETLEQMTVSTDDFNDIVTDAAASETAAAASAAAALVSKNKAHDWAEEDEDVEVETGEYSAHHWALKAADYATGFPTGTSLIMYQASPPIGWSILDVGDKVVGISNGTTKLYDGKNPGNLTTGTWVVDGLTCDPASIAHNHRWYNYRAGDDHGTYDTSGTAIYFDDINADAGEDGFWVRQDSGKKPNVDLFTNNVAVNIPATVVDSTGAWRTPAVVCLVAVKD